MKQPTKVDWEKLIRVIKFLYKTKHDKRIIGINDITTLLTYIDASYAVHENMRCHTGGLITMSIGILHGKASKQKINTKSSIESEIVGLSEYLPYTLWMGYFLEAQGYKMKKSTVFQDNSSALKIEKNGRNSCT